MLPIGSEPWPAFHQTAVGNPAIRDPQLDVLLGGADPLERLAVGEIPGAELQSGIPHAGRLELFEFDEQITRYFVQPYFRIQAQRGLQIPGLQGTAGDGVEAVA